MLLIRIITRERYVQVVWKFVDALMNHFRLAGDYESKYVQLIFVLVPGDVDCTAAWALLGPRSSSVRLGPLMDPVTPLFKDCTWQQFSRKKNFPTGFNWLMPGEGCVKKRAKVKLQCWQSRSTSTMVNEIINTPPDIRIRVIQFSRILMQWVCVQIMMRWFVFW